MNVYGAEKATEYFGKILSEECDIPNRKDDPTINDKWNNRVKIYNERKAKMEADEK